MFFLEPLRYLYENSLKSLLASGTTKIPRISAANAIIAEPIRYGLISFFKENPELYNATISESDANLEVNHITERNKNNGNSEFEKYIVKL
jgi:hypothetical protein